jgi:hypothetical protein
MNCGIKLAPLFSSDLLFIGVSDINISPLQKKSILAVCGLYLTPSTISGSLLPVDAAKAGRLAFSLNIPDTYE